MKRRWLIMSMLLTPLLVWGCEKADNNEKINDIEFTVCDDSKVPKEFLQEINKKKAEVFTATFADGEYMYVAKGYGKQPTGGYSINVTEMYVTKDKIVMDTNLIGPGQKDLVLREATYPYIVVKTEYSQKDVVCDE